MVNKNTKNINLETVHRQMMAKYLVTSELEKDKKDAQDIQRFFRKLNKEFEKGDTNLISNLAYRSIAEQIKTQHSQLKHLFKVKSGTDFEKRIWYILEGVVNAAVKETQHEAIDTNIILTAKQTGSTFDLKDFESEIAQQVLQKSGVKTTRYLQKENTSKDLYLANVQRKSDISMVDVSISGEETSQVLKIYNLLKGSTFSLKNYDSNIRQYAKDWWTKGLKLGGASFVRSIGASLSSLGYEPDDIFNLLKNNQEKYQIDKNIQNHFDHLAFIYELTGGGMRLKNNKLEYAKFLIFNDPSGQIYVRSSRELLKKMFDEQMVISESVNGKKYYTIKKSIFR